MIHYNSLSLKENWMAQVQCIKCGKEKDAISGPVYGGRIGEELKAKICNECWKEWFEDMSVKVINEYRLNLSDPKATKFLTSRCGFSKN
jgi:Fe-S cluster biosynthesis and repair protein YggX